MKEIVQIRVGIIPIFVDTPTDYKILVDDTVLSQSYSRSISGQIEYHAVEIELESGTHNLDIRLDPTNKQFENIEIAEVYFNDQRLRNDDLFLMSEYLLDQERLVDGVLTNRIDQCTCIGWAGVYRIKFPTPIIPWLLRNIW